MSLCWATNLDSFQVELPPVAVTSAANTINNGFIRFLFLSRILNHEFVNARHFFIQTFAVLVLVAFQHNTAFAQSNTEKNMMTHADDLFAKRQYEQAFLDYMHLKDL